MKKDKAANERRKRSGVAYMIRILQCIVIVDIIIITITIIIIFTINI